MIKVITYGTFDVLHYGHIRLLERAKALGDELIVGVTSDDYDRTRGKINNQQTLSERIEAVRALGIADEVIVEEYDGQKIDDIRKYGVDIFAVGSDWEGKFDYLSSCCKVVYLPRTTGVSSTDIRTENRMIRLGVVGEIPLLRKFVNESRFVNGCKISGLCSRNKKDAEEYGDLDLITDDFDKILEVSDALYIASHPTLHYEQIKKALKNGKHVVCESPVALGGKDCDELYEIAKKSGLILMDAIKTAYSTAYARMLLLVESGAIGKVVSVDATCTSLRSNESGDPDYYKKSWNSSCDWGPTAFLPVFQLLGTDYKDARVISSFADEDKDYDLFSKIDFTYDSAVATVKVGKGVKSEGELVVSGTKGYVYVPAPWWKTDYFEIRYENPENNKRYFYQLNGEGIRYEIVAFIKAIESGRVVDMIPRDVSRAICEVVSNKNRIEI